MTGMMLHQDASPHRWIPALEASFDLVITLDDATGEIDAAFLVDEEDTASTFQALLAVFGRHGLPCSLSPDRGSHYFITPKAGGKPDPNVETQVGRALAQLGIEHIPAYSPEARGRCDRAFRTLQDRLPKELALAGITSVEEADRFLREVYLAAQTPALRSPPSRRARPSSRSIQRSSPISCASRRNVESATTTR